MIAAQRRLPSGTAAVRNGCAADGGKRRVMKNRKGKVMGFLLAGVLAAVSLSACGQSGEGTQTAQTKSSDSGETDLLDTCLLYTSSRRNSCSPR